MFEASHIAFAAGPPGLSPCPAVELCWSFDLVCLLYFGDLVNWTYCTHIPKWFHPNHHGQLQKPTGGWWNAAMPISLPLGFFARRIHRKRGKGKGGKEKHEKLKKKVLELRKISLKQLLERSFGGGDVGGNGEFWTLIWHFQIGEW